MTDDVDNAAAKFNLFLDGGGGGWVIVMRMAIKRAKIQAILNRPPAHIINII